MKAFGNLSKINKIVPYHIDDSKKMCETFAGK